MKVEEQEIFQSGECSMCKGPMAEGRGCIKIVRTKINVAVFRGKWRVLWDDTKSARWSAMFFVLRDLASSTSNGNLSKGLNKEGKKSSFCFKKYSGKV